MQPVAPHEARRVFVVVGEARHHALVGYGLFHQHQLVPEHHGHRLAWKSLDKEARKIGHYCHSGHVAGPVNAPAIQP